MSPFVLHHVDALFSTVAGLILTIYSYRRPQHGRPLPSPVRRRAAHVLRFVAPLVFLFGLVSFFI